MLSGHKNMDTTFLPTQMNSAQQLLGLKTLNNMNPKFGKYSFKEGEESRLKLDYFDLKMNPREWMARFGHNVSGDMRIYQYEDKVFEKWIYEAFEALAKNGIESLWEEYLTEEEIREVRRAYNNF